MYIFFFCCNFSIFGFIKNFFVIIFLILLFSNFFVVIAVVCFWILVLVLENNIAGWIFISLFVIVCFVLGIGCIVIIFEIFNVSVKVVILIYLYSFKIIK